MQTLKWILQLSRPRFWFYLLGPVLLAVAALYNNDIYLFGKAAISNGYQDWLILTAILLFFSLPANLLIYGINDLFDYETDKHNDKKKSYETLLEPKNRKQFLRLFFWIVTPFFLFLVLALNMDYVSYSGWIYSTNVGALLALVGFLFFGIFYSAPPIRAKIRPFLDALFNILYIFPGLLTYAAFTGEYPPLVIILAACSWVMAMHAFSAVPDIAADKLAGIKTIATICGKNSTIILCSALYGLSAALVFGYLGIVSLIGGAVYVLLMIAAVTSRTSAQLFSVYKLFPYVNVALGFVLFWTIYFINN
jgi:4-hydroxybenzoate polyprenyltransferase